MRFLQIVLSFAFLTTVASAQTVRSECKFTFNMGTGNVKGVLTLMQAPKNPMIEVLRENVKGQLKMGSSEVQDLGKGHFSLHQFEELKKDEEFMELVQIVGIKPTNVGQVRSFEFGENGTLYFEMLNRSTYSVEHSFVIVGGVVVARCK